jgi:peptidoglycan/LPS O-acetylase OafA/YrhL
MNRIPSLDGLRGIAITLVLLGHLGGTRHFLSANTMARAGDVGNLGVRLFFVISGFLITLLLLGEIDQRQHISLKAFYIRRVLRIFPAFYVFIASATLLAGIGFASLDRRDVIHAVTYTMNYHATYSTNFSLHHLWSLAVEEQFYLLWPLTLAVLMAPRAERVLVAVVLAVPILRVAAYTFIPGYENIADTGFEGVCDALAIGCLLAMAMPRLIRLGWLNRLVLGPLFPVVFVAIFIANKQRNHPKFFWLLCVPFMNTALALTVLRYVRAPSLPLGRLLNRQPLISIGVLSYSLYLWQQLFLIQSRPVTSVFVIFPLNVLTAFACAALSYHLVETPFLRLKRRFEPGRAQVAPPSAAEPEPPAVLRRLDAPSPSSHFVGGWRPAPHRRDGLLDE